MKISKKILKNNLKNLTKPNLTKKGLPSVTDHRENEGMFRFGRLIDDDEKIIFKEKDGLKQIEDASRKFQMYFE